MSGNYTLHGAPGTGSVIVEAALVKAGAPFSVVNMWERGDTDRPRLRSAEFAALNPLLQVPCLILPDGTTMTESAAILLHLASKFPDSELGPPPSDTAATATFLRQMFTIYNMYSSITRIFHTERYTTEPAGKAGIRTAAANAVVQSAEIVEAWLSRSGDCICGQSVTIADVFLTMVLNSVWSPNQEALRDLPKLCAIRERVYADPLFGPILGQHGLGMAPATTSATTGRSSPSSSPSSGGDTGQRQQPEQQEQEQVPAACYSWSWHHELTIKQKLRHLKRELTALQLAHLHDLSLRWIRSMQVSLTDSTILRRFLPWDARGFGTDPAPSPETDALWGQCIAQLVTISERFEHAVSPDEAIEPAAHVDRFVAEAMGECIEPLFLEQEAWEDTNLEERLPAILERHCWRGKVGAAPGLPAPAPAAAGPWFGAFRYTIDGDGGARASVHIHNHVAPDSPFSDRLRLFDWFVDMVEHLREHEPQCTQIGTATWLNNYTAYVGVFPPSYAASLSRGDGSSKGMSAWGQYITSGLELNQGKAGMLRSELRFSNHMLTATVELDDFENHVRREQAKEMAAAPSAIAASAAGRCDGGGSAEAKL